MRTSISELGGDFSTVLLDNCVEIRCQAMVSRSFNESKTLGYPACTPSDCHLGQLSAPKTVDPFRGRIDGRETREITTATNKSATDVERSIGNIEVEGFLFSKMSAHGVCELR